MLYFSETRHKDCFLCKKEITDLCIVVQDTTKGNLYSHFSCLKRVFGFTVDCRTCIKEKAECPECCDYDHWEWNNERKICK